MLLCLLHVHEFNLPEPGSKRMGSSSPRAAYRPQHFTADRAVPELQEAGVQQRTVRQHLQVQRVEPRVVASIARIPPLRT